MKEFLVAMFITIVVLGIVFIPIAIIWSLNILFPILAIPYTIKTWAAALILSSVLAARVSTSVK